ncbi:MULTISPECIES: hypothetical protein [unclassified Gilliamella]|uniref:hypothetical protein n=1 Tax=unclassified Gilliamella TaxID=2685620 RepID=UPI00226A5B34|nr:MULTISPECIES: hypothetical protein [unclassified Gilliamella]MCX8573836.1 hypothetical protein [Gilliamella sp. B3831]MCX8576067.1 hypothetical protein [Gilliamella sp. B3815]MCX8590634.1 hypothetical protein [Gilliamella sp. B3812]MCX8603168.1 hypothetical protein [Gilliamella sp. B3823]MCX8605269.1 hypothetical protein [Gilliamella sp. B3825]
MGYDNWIPPAGWVDVAGRTIADLENNSYKQIVRAGIKELSRIRICRLPTLVLGGRIEWDTDTAPGHYWIEIINDLSKMDGSEKFIESYGWYPQEPATFFNAFTTDGCLNSDCEYFRAKDDSNRDKQEKDKNIPNEAGRARITEEDKIYSLYPFDPHHNKRYTLPNSDKGKVNHPYLFANDPRTEDDVIEEIRNFAISHISEEENNVDDKSKNKAVKKWSYAFEHYAEYNCHTFLFNLLYEVNLADRYILKDLHFMRFLASADDHKNKYRYISDHYGNIYKLKNHEDIRKQANEVYNKMKKVNDNAKKLAEILKP